MERKESFLTEFENYFYQWHSLKKGNLYQPIQYILEQKGKKMRPILALIGANFFSENTEAALPIAAAVEYFHNFTLVHDDIMDEADIRRGKETVVKKYGRDNAILSGDVMLINAYEYLMRSNSSNLNSILKIFNKTAIEVCEGQQFDMDFEERNDVSIDEYLNMIKLKTAVLLGASLQMGYLAVDGDIDKSKVLYDSGVNAGLSFQLMDDILDTFGNQENFGKRIGGDILQNKKTYLYLSALQNANEKQKQELSFWFNQEKVADEEEKIEAIKHVYNQLNIETLSKEKAIEYNNLAIKNLTAFEDKAAQTENLVALYTTLISRIT